MAGKYVSATHLDVDGAPFCNLKAAQLLTTDAVEVSCYICLRLMRTGRMDPQKKRERMAYLARGGPRTDLKMRIKGNRCTCHTCLGKGGYSLRCPNCYSIWANGPYKPHTDTCDECGHVGGVRVTGLTCRS